ncbi:MAG: 30S ribosomal protein S6 [bacterium]
MSYLVAFCEMEDDTKKEYELVALVDNETTEVELDKFLADDEKAEVFNKMPAKLLNLAYPIKKHNSATMLVYHFYALPEKIIEIKKGLIFQPHVLRSLITTPIIKNNDSNRNSYNKKKTTTTTPIMSSNELLVKTLKKLEE